MKRVFSGEIPAYRLDGKRSPYYFNKSDIVEALKKGKIEVLHNTEY